MKRIFRDPPRSCCTGQLSRWPRGVSVGRLATARNRPFSFPLGGPGRAHGAAATPFDAAGGDREGFSLSEAPACGPNSTLVNLGPSDTQYAGSVPANRLAEETSPYLRQHADNPVEWYPWGEAALDRARQEDKPIFLSIGYASCHWCHVMAHESFEDPATAADLAKWFVSVKVDREERPDLDAVYMAATQALTGSGGWPMSVFCTPDGRPFYAGTYFPPEERRWHAPRFAVSSKRSVAPG